LIADDWEEEAEEGVALVSEWPLVGRDEVPEAVEDAQLCWRACGR
jgi:hypothetical protein